MEIIAALNRKGGVGKTATMQALGAGLTQRGYKVLYVDLDSQTNLTFSMGADLSKASTMELLAGMASADQVLQHAPGGDILPANKGLAEADKTFIDEGKEFLLKKALEPVKDLYDYVLIDTPAALGILTVNALTCANRCIIPVQPDLYSIQGVSLLNEPIEAVKRYTNKGLIVDGLLITRYDTRTIISRDMKANMEELAKALGTKVYKTPIRECAAIKEAQAKLTDIFTYARRSNAAKDYNNFIDEFLKR